MSINTAAVCDPKHRRGMSLRELLIVVCIIAGLTLLLVPAVQQARDAAPKSRCRNNLKVIGLALRNYHDTFGQFPPACTLDETGKPLHSWRTLLLPYLDQEKLYESIDLSKPWDDPANSAAAKTVIPQYECPDAHLSRATSTYLAVVTPQSCLQQRTSHSLADIKDHPSPTLLIIEVDAKHAVPWMSPTDADEDLILSLSAQSRPPHRATFHALLADGGVRGVSVKLSATDRRALISIAGNDIVSGEN